MPRRYRFMQMDVFASRLGDGNPLAVVLDAADLDGATMQRLARWTNLSETAFLLPPTQPGANYRVRIFTPRQELPFAGHPSVGSAFAAREAGLVAPDKTTLVQECAAGLLPVEVEHADGGARIHVQAPPARFVDVDEALPQTLARALGFALHATAVRLVDNGPRWLLADLDEGERVRALRPDMAALAALSLSHGVVGVAVFGREREGPASLAVRAFCPADGIPEDPVTGSANAAIAAMRHARGEGVLRYHASQGREVGRDGIVQVRVEDASPPRVWIGGTCVIGVRGELSLDG